MLNNMILLGVAMLHSMISGVAMLLKLMQIVIYLGWCVL